MAPPGSSGLDRAAFPATPANWYWTASPYVGYAAYAWYVLFSNGSVYYGSRNYRLLDYVQIGIIRECPRRLASLLNG